MTVKEKRGRGRPAGSSPETYQYTDQDLKRFWSHVNKNGSIPVHCPELGKCWEWTLSCNKHGYGHFGLNKHCRLAHRISWLMSIGSIPSGLSVLHKCDNTKCVNPKHLWLGTRKDNIEDMVTKERQSKGEKNGQHKLTEDIVRSIREQYMNEDITHNQLSAIYGVHQSGITRIIQRRIWKHI